MAKIDILVDDFENYKKIKQSIQMDMNLLTCLNIEEAENETLLLDATTKFSIKLLNKILKSYKNILLIFDEDNLKKYADIIQEKDLNFIVKPYSQTEMKIRIQRMILKKEKIHYKNIELNNPDKCLYIDDIKVSLTAMEYKIIHLLIQKKGQLVTKEELLKSIWEEEFLQEKNISKLRVAIFRLKQKLNAFNIDDFFQAKKGFGYYVDTD